MSNIVKSLVLTSIVTGITVAVARGVEMLKVEQAVSALVPQVAQEPELAVAVLCVVFYVLQGLLSAVGSVARASFGVRPPIVHATEKDVVNKSDRLSFLRGIRVLENYLETAPQLVFVVLVHHAVVRQPATLLALGAINAAARVLYAAAYSNNVSRSLPFIVVTLSYSALNGAVALAVLRKFGVPVPL